MTGKGTGMDKDAAARIQWAAARNPESDTAQSGFDSRAQSALIAVTSRPAQTRKRAAERVGSASSGGGVAFGLPGGERFG
jgi:alpha/beta superfamily hydrolase